MKHAAIFTTDDFEEMLNAEYESPCGINVLAVEFNIKTHEVVVTYEVTR